jgi:hypothetical protein
MRHSPWILLALASLACTASADVVHLKHGGKVEGEVVSDHDHQVIVRVKGGGTMVLPKAAVRRVESRAAALEEYADRVLDVDFDDPAAVERLSLWCSYRGLGDKATELDLIAKGVRLERLVQRAQRRADGRGLVDVYHWARGAGLDDAVQLWLLDQGARRGANDPVVRRAYDHFRAGIAERRRRAAYLAELRKRPRYVMPGRQSFGSVAPSVAALKARILAARKARGERGASAAAEKAFLEEAKSARIRELEARAGRLEAREARQRKSREEAREDARRRAEAERERLAQEEEERWAKEREARKGR